MLKELKNNTTIRRTLPLVRFMASLERRGALDIGSGSTKLVVADVRHDGSLVDVLYGQEIPGATGAACESVDWQIVLQTHLDVSPSVGRSGFWNRLEARWR